MHDVLVPGWTFFRFTGGVFNPAITCALFLANPRRFGIRRWFIYTIMQLVGGILAALLADVAFPTDTAVTVNFPDNGTSAKQAVVLELIGTYLLTSVVLMGAVEKSRCVLRGLTRTVIH
jgi:aquaporin related protein